MASDPVEAGAPITSRSAHLLSLGVATGVVVLDQATKRWAIDRLGDGSTIDIVWTLRWNLAYNSGMAFGTGTGFGPIIALVATAVIVWLLISLRNQGSRLSAVGVGLVIGGAIGNVLDRAFRGDGFMNGSVVDFIDLQWFPIFNVADMAINIGAAILIIETVRLSRHRSDPADSPA